MMIAKKTSEIKKIIINQRMRLDKYLSIYYLDNKFLISRSYIQKLINDHKILVNNNKVYKNKVVNNGDVITITLENIKWEVAYKANPSIKINIIYEDNDVIVINKQNNLVVHPGINHYDDTLLNGLLAYTNKLSDINGDLRLGIVHRIDRLTTGLLVVAKTNYAHNELAMQLKNKTMYREYHTIVHRNFSHRLIKIDAPIKRDPNNRTRMGVIKNGKSSVTNVSVIKNFKNYSYLKCLLETGRTHQIRVHLKYINHPILGDNVYGLKSDQNNTYGQYLHAKKLAFIHPTSKKNVEFVALPDDVFVNKLNQLKGNNSTL